jgi:hypothetical protein
MQAANSCVADLVVGRGRFWYLHLRGVNGEAALRQRRWGLDARRLRNRRTARWARGRRDVGVGLNSFGGSVMWAQKRSSGPGNALTAPLQCSEAVLGGTAAPAGGGYGGRTGARGAGTDPLT